MPKHRPKPSNKKRKLTSGKKSEGNKVELNVKSEKVEWYK